MEEEHNSLIMLPKHPTGALHIFIIDNHLVYDISYDNHPLSQKLDPCLQPIQDNIWGKKYEVHGRLGQISEKESPVGIFEEKGANHFF